MGDQMTSEEVKREKDRLKKQRSRQRQKEIGQIVDLADKRRRLIQNICLSINVRSDLKN